MRMQALLALLTMFTLAFAGCAGDNGEPETQDDQDAQPSATQTATQTTTAAATSTTSATTTTTAQPPANQAPTGSISAIVNATNASFSLTGSDPDGDTIAWDLEFGDGETTSGTTLPATVEHMYAVGNFTASFTITDGKSPVTYELEIPIVAAPDAAGILFIQGQEFPSNPLSSLVIPEVGYAGAEACVGFHAGENGQDCVWFELDLAFEGRAFTITSDAGDPDYEFWPVCSTVDASTTPPGPIFAFDGSTADGPEAGIIPAGAGCVVIWTKLPPDMPTHTFTVL